MMVQYFDIMMSHIAIEFFLFRHYNATSLSYNPIWSIILIKVNT